MDGQHPVNSVLQMLMIRHEAAQSKGVVHTQDGHIEVQPGTEASEGLLAKAQYLANT